VTKTQLVPFDYFNKTPISKIHTSSSWWTLCSTDGGDDMSERRPPCSYLKLSSQQPKSIEI